MSQPSIGLRALKKQMTRSSIATAALELTLERGLDHVTLDEIAHRAFVSPRTVSNYFSGKEEAIAAAGRDLKDTLLDDLARRSADESPLESVHRIAVDFVRSLSPEELESQRRKRLLGEQHPSIKAYLTARYESVEEMLRPALASRIGADDDYDIYPWLLAASAVTAVRIAVTRWVTSHGDLDKLIDLLEEAFAHLRDGLETPPPAPGRSAVHGTGTNRKQRRRPSS
ncbi:MULTISPECIES: TetR family transcriptional regulator [unclassified Nocardioides]|uniref:acyl-CoA-like ligand-binding transcription factor n=1 Tax=unclassified Nocardioides TaxID=2615069 RepID=UPI00360C7F9A